MSRQSLDAILARFIRNPFHPPAHIAALSLSLSRSSFLIRRVLRRARKIVAGRYPRSAPRRQCDDKNSIPGLPLPRTGGEFPSCRRRKGDSFHEVAIQTATRSFVGRPIGAIGAALKGLSLSFSLSLPSDACTRVCIVRQHTQARPAGEQLGYRSIERTENQSDRVVITSYMKPRPRYPVESRIYIETSM